jgi:hypothetical protein
LTLPLVRLLTSSAQCVICLPGKVPAGAKKAYLSVISSDKAGNDKVAATPTIKLPKSRDIEKVDMGNLEK